MQFGAPDRWLSDEIVFSFCSRWHRLSTHRLSRQTTLHLFGHHQTGSGHDFPARIDWFASRMDGRLGTPDSIVRERTILPYYLPFRSWDTAAEAIGRMRGNGIGSLKFQLGLLTSRFRAHHPLKWCPKCTASEIRSFGAGLWRLPHQLPGTWVCAQHDEPLATSTAKVGGVERFLWHLPGEDAARPPPGTPSPIADGRLQALARLDHRLWSLAAGQHFEPIRLLQTYLSALSGQGLATAAGRIRLTKAAEAYAAHVAPLRNIPALTALPATPAQAGVQLGRLFRLPRTGTHPLRHLVVISWLFPTWEAFADAYSNQAVPLEKGQPGGALAEDNADSLKLIERTQHLPHQEVGPRKPKRLHEPIRQAIIAELRQGADQTLLARKWQFSEQTIARVLRSQPGLQERWNCVRLERMRVHRRRQWALLLSSHPTSGIKSLRLIAPATFTWLYRHDRTWLRTGGAPPRVGSTGNHASIAWDERDRAIARAIEEAALRLHESQPGRRIKRQDLLRAVPELSPRMRTLDRLPLTLQVMMAVLASKPAKSKPMQHSLI